MTGRALIGRHAQCQTFIFADDAPPRPWPTASPCPICGEDIACDPGPREVVALLATLERDLATWHNRGRSVIIDTNEGEEL